jgi:hypothetical protein
MALICRSSSRTSVSSAASSPMLMPSSSTTRAVGAEAAREPRRPDLYEWVRGEFDRVPLTFFRQMARCARASQLLSWGTPGTPGLPARFAAAPLVS